MQPTSDAQFRAGNTGELPPIERVRDDVLAVPQRMPGIQPPYSLAYVIADSTGGLHLVDPGWDSAENRRNLTGALEGTGMRLGDVRTITVTHLHPDHVGLAAWVRAESSARLVLHESAEASGGESLPTEPLMERLDLWGVPTERRAELSLRGARDELPALPEADELVADGALLDVPGSEIRVLWTPGHTRGHICIEDAGRGLIYTGDHVLPTIHGGLGLDTESGEDPIAAYLGSLQRVSGYDDHEVLPGHGYRFRGVAERAAAHREHHLRRSREVAAVLAETPDATTWSVASRLTWTAGWEGLNGFYLASALFQTEMHRRFVTGGGLAEFDV